jgi:hypothetical protein
MVRVSVHGVALHHLRLRRHARHARVSVRRWDHLRTRVHRAAVHARTVRRTWRPVLIHRGVLRIRLEVAFGVGVLMREERVLRWRARERIVLWRISEGLMLGPVD